MISLRHGIDHLKRINEFIQAENSKLKSGDIDQGRGTYGTLNSSNGRTTLRKSGPSGPGIDQKIKKRPYYCALI